MTRATPLAGSVTTLALIVATGCSSGNSDTRAVRPPPVQPAKATVSPAAGTATLADFNASIGAAHQQVDAVLASLAALTDPAQADVRGAYDKYCDNLSRMQQHAASMKTEAEAMRASREAYFVNWEEKSSNTDNETVRASAEARRKRLQDSHDQIVSSTNAVKDAYAPFIKDLEAIKSYVANDISKSNVANLADATKKVQAGGADLKQKLDTLGKTLTMVQGA